jgi:transcriptional regulator with XRE-family HTH domain
MAKKGRPKWQPDLERARQLAAQGLTREQIACALGVSRSTVFERINDNSDFSDAIKAGAADGIAAVTNALFKSALDGNTTAQIFFLKCRAGWQDRNQVELSGSLEVTPTTLDDAALLRAAQTFVQMKG